MAAFFPRVGRNNHLWKLLLPPFSKKPVKFSRGLQTLPVPVAVVLQNNCSRGFLRSGRTERTVLSLGVRHYSQETSDYSSGELLQDNTTISNPFIPEQPADSINTGTELLKDVADAVNSLGEPTLSSLGLGGSSPIGLVQHTLELVHTYFNLPWVWSIVAVTVGFRLLMFPLIVKSQANAARLNNIKPQLEEIQSQLRELMNTNDAVGKATATFKMKQLYKDNNCHPVKSIIAPLIQLPLFVSFFIGLRRMATLPLESLQTGGLWWFTDLTTYDPYFVLPILCSFSMLASIELGGEAGVSNPQMKSMKAVFRVMCIVMIPLTAQFPTAIFTYWITSNICSLGQVSLLRVKAAREYFGIPDMKMHTDLTAQGGFWENMKAGYSSAQDSAYVRHHEKMKRQKAKAIGNAPLEPTYEHNPRIKHNQEVFASNKTNKGQDKFKDKAGPSM